MTWVLFLLKVYSGIFQLIKSNRLNRMIKTLREGEWYYQSHESGDQIWLFLENWFRLRNLIFCWPDLIHQCDNYPQNCTNDLVKFERIDLWLFLQYFTYELNKMVAKFMRNRVSLDCKFLLPLKVWFDCIMRHVYKCVI